MTSIEKKKKPEPSAIYKETKLPTIPTVYDFKQFMGYAGQYGREPLDSWPYATD